MKLGARSYSHVLRASSPVSPIYQVRSTVLPRRGTEPIFLNVITGKVEGQLPCLLEAEELRG